MPAEGRSGVTAEAKKSAGAQVPMGGSAGNYWNDAVALQAQAVVAQQQVCIMLAGTHSINEHIPSVSEDEHVQEHHIDPKPQADITLLTVSGRQCCVYVFMIAV
jgi:hypothetical protein